MKQTSRVFALLLAALLLLAVIPAPSLAAARIVTMQKDYWYGLKSVKKDSTYYKLNLSSDSIVTVYWRNVNEWAGVTFYSRASGSAGICEASIHERNGSAAVALAKGTYYIRMGYDGEKGSSIPQVRVIVKKPVNKANYSKSKAVALSANTKVRIAQTDNNSYDRWYRIKLTKKKVVTLKAPQHYTSSILLYNSKSEKIACKRGEYKIVSKNALSAGTYYIRVKTPNEFEEDDVFYSLGEDPKLGYLIILSWS